MREFSTFYIKRANFIYETDFMSLVFSCGEAGLRKGRALQESYRD
jgi:hypothetical protein